MKAWSLALIGVVLCGCTSVNTNDGSPTVNKALSVQVPEYNDLSLVKLPNGRRYICLGDSEDKAMSLFARPSRGFPLEDTIPGFPNDFTAKGWESNQEGFGIVLHDDKIVLAMHQYEAVDADEFASILKNVQDINGIDHFQAITVNKADYWYLFIGRDDLIISRIPSAKKHYQVTVTIGNDQVIRNLGILKDVPRDGTTKTK